MNEITDAFVKDATTEYLSHRGEQPYSVLRSGAQLWETHAPAIRAALTAANRLSRDPAPETPEADLDPAEVWEDYLEEVTQEEDRSLQGALAFGFWAAFNAVSQSPSTAINSVVSADRDQIAKVLSVIWLGDTVEWKGFLSKADAFLAYPWPAAEPVAMTASAEPVAWTVERKKSVYDKLAEEGGGTWATYMMMDIEDAFATLPSDAARKAVLAIVKDAFNRDVRSGMKEHTSSKGGNTWVEERPALESRLNAALSAAPVSAWQPSRDDMAKVIDPSAWVSATNVSHHRILQHKQADALAKADAILALAPPRNDREGAAK